MSLKKTTNGLFIERSNDISGEWDITNVIMVTNSEIESTVNNGRGLNKKSIERCQKAERTIRELRQAYNQPVSEKFPFVISFVGRFKTGKSSLINALIGAEILPTKATTATSVVTRIFYGTTPKCWLRTTDEDKEISIEEGKDIILNYKVTDVNNSVEVIFELPIPWIKENIELRDTPGMDDSSQDGRLEAVAMNALKDTDLCVCVYDAGAVFSQKERARTQKIYDMMSGNLVYAVNCTNRLNSLESINQVESIAEKFFGAMDYSLPGMGKYYMMCTAPKMIDMDGFDKWMQTFVDKRNITVLNKLRKSTGNGQVTSYREKFSIEAGRLFKQLDEQLKQLTDMHNEIVIQQGRANNQAAQEELAVFNQKSSKLEETFVKITPVLREKIQACKDKGTDYETNTKSATEEYFIVRYKSIIGNYGDYFSKNDVQFIRQVFQIVTFPGTHTKAVKATSGEKNGWTIAGTVIGSIIAPGAGSVIGAAIGRAIGAADTTADDSVDNTLSFVGSSIVPLMRTAINNKISEVKKGIKAKGNRKCSSGLESLIAETNSVQQKLKQYCK